VVYFWDFGVTSSSSDTSTAMNPEYTYSIIGTYTVKLIVYSANGNDTITKTINVINNNQGVAEIKNAIAAMSLYPNPSNGEVNLDFTLNQSSTIVVRIMEISGKKVMVKENNEILNDGNHHVGFDASALTNGIYFVSIHTENGTKTKRLIIAK
jgi:PKD repeat protein